MQIYIKYQHKYFKWSNSTTLLRNQGAEAIGIQLEILLRSKRLKG